MAISWDKKTKYKLNWDQYNILRKKYAEPYNEI